jgi:hypothetical protein
MTDQIKYSPTPWEANGCCIYAEKQMIGKCYHPTKPYEEIDVNAAHIVKCVNERDELVAIIKEYEAATQDLRSNDFDSKYPVFIKDRYGSKTLEEQLNNINYEAAKLLTKISMEE